MTNYSSADNLAMTRSHQHQHLAPANQNPNIAQQPAQWGGPNTTGGATNYQLWHYPPAQPPPMFVGGGAAAEQPWMAQAPSTSLHGSIGSTHPSRMTPPNNGGKPNTVGAPTEGLDPRSPMTTPPMAPKRRRPAPRRLRFESPSTIVVRLDDDENGGREVSTVNDEEEDGMSSLGASPEFPPSQRQEDSIDQLIESPGVVDDGGDEIMFIDERHGNHEIDRDQDHE